MHRLCPYFAISSWFPLFCLFFGLTAPLAKGIQVKFLPNSPEDSVARYMLFRSEKAGEPGLPIADLVPVLPTDTLVIPDSSAEKGKAYFYSLKAVAKDGASSELSTQSRIAHPLLLLPDTLIIEEGFTVKEFPLEPALLPLGNEVPLELQHSDSALFSIRVDSLAGRLLFESRFPSPFIRKISVTAAYYGKFVDTASLVVISGNSPVTSTLNSRATIRGEAKGKTGPVFDVMGRVISLEGGFDQLKSPGRILLPD